MKVRLAHWALVALMVGALAGCGGGGGGTPAPDGAGGTTSPTALPAAPVPPGNARINVANLTPDQLAALQPAIVFGGAVVSSPPQVSFAVQDPSGNPIVGLGRLRVPQGDLEFLRFSMAKLVPGAPVAGTTTTTPSKWVNYIVVTAAGAAQRPNAERDGTLVDNGNGTYTYTFKTDVTRVKDQIAGMTFTGENRAADLGDLTYVPTLTHRLTIQLSGGGLENPANGIYDFVPATGARVAATETDPTKQRNVVSVNNCNECHERLAIHGDARINTQYCVVCHTDQRRYGRANVVSTNLAFPALTETATVNATTGYTSYSYSPATYVGDGEAMGDFPRLIHKVHQGADLVKQNYNYANFAFNLKHFSMLGGGQRSCAKCHKDSTDARQTANWQNTPSRIACGACHDGINFNTGAGTTLGGLTTGHVGGAQPDTRCALCHDASNVPVYHQTTDKTRHNPTIPAGLVTFTYEIQSATVDGSNNVIVRFKISRDGAALTSLPPAGFTGGPAFLLAWAMPQDNIGAPIDFNNINASNTFAPNIKGDATSIGIVSGGGNLLSAGRITGPDGSGYFTATIPSANGFPVGARMRTVAMQSGFTQAAGTNGIAANTARNAISVTKTVTGDAERRRVIDPAKCTNCHEWLKLHGGSRVLAPETTGTVVCLMCHVPGKATSGRGIDDAAVNTYAGRGGFSTSDLKVLAEWGLGTTFPVSSGNTWALGLPVTTNNFKDMIHGIHKGRERVSPFQDARDRLGGSPKGASGAIALLDFRRLDFPGIINNCQTCHAPGTYSDVPAGALASTYESVNATYNANYGLASATTAMALASLDRPNPTDRVTSPFAAACVACHDSTVARNHIQISGGGQLMVARQALVTGLEQCSFCHGPGKIVDVAVAHRR